MKPWQHVASGALGGILLVGGVGYLFANQAVAFFNNMKYVEAAANARAQVSVLVHLEQGETAQAAKIVDVLLAANEGLMSALEEDLGISHDAKVVREAKASIASYRERNPRP
jgi:hypothetical protein